MIFLLAVLGVFVLVCWAASRERTRMPHEFQGRTVTCDLCAQETDAPCHVQMPGTLGSL